MADASEATGDTAPTPAPFAELEQSLGYAFRDPNLLRRALTHSSGAQQVGHDNERLEFFGDSVLSLVVCEHLFTACPDSGEGELTEVKSAVVSRTVLSEASRALRIPDHLILGRGIGRKRPLPASVCANALEAVIAAIYLDGGLEAARDLIQRHLGCHIDAARRQASRQNYKSLLQQFTQRELRTGLEYRILEEEGPDHRKIFTVAVWIDGEMRGRGSGWSKKEAEQDAARNALRSFGEGDGGDDNGNG